MTPPSNFIMLLIALGLIFLVLLVLGLKRNTKIYILACVIILGSIVLGYYSLLSYSAIKRRKSFFNSITTKLFINGKI